MKTRVIYGIHTVRHTLQRDSARVLRVHLLRNLGTGRLTRLADELRSVPVDVQRCDAETLERLTGTPKHQGVAATVEQAESLDEHDALDLVREVERPLLLVLDGIQDPRNLGSCLRTAEAAGVDLVVVGRSRSPALSPAVSKVASGAAELQPIARVANLARFLEQLKELGVWVIGTDGEAQASLYDTDLRGPVAIVLGAEGRGLRRLTRDRCDALVRLPMRGVVESLNVSVATGVCIYECLRQRGLS